MDGTQLPTDDLPLLAVEMAPLTGWLFVFANGWPCVNDSVHGRMGWLASVGMMPKNSNHNEAVFSRPLHRVNIRGWDEYLLTYLPTDPSRHIQTRDGTKGFPYRAAPRPLPSDCAGVGGDLMPKSCVSYMAINPGRHNQMIKPRGHTSRAALGTTILNNQGVAWRWGNDTRPGQGGGSVRVVRFVLVASGIRRNLRSYRD